MPGLWPTEKEALNAGEVWRDREMPRLASRPPSAVGSSDCAVRRPAFRTNRDPRAVEWAFERAGSGRRPVSALRRAR